MKKLKKYSFILIILLMLSGCTAKSNVTMDSYGKVKEEVTIGTSSNEISNNKDNVNDVINMYFDKYKYVLNYRGYTKEKIDDEKMALAKFTNDYENICSYFQDTVFNQYIFKHISCTQTDEYYEIKNDTNYIPYCEDCSDWPKLDEVELNLKLPIKALETNADSIKKNVYTWYFDKYTPGDKSIYVKIDKTKLKENEVKYERKNKVLNVAKLILKIVVIIAILIGLGFGSNKLYKKYKSNKLEY